ncbi:MAG: hypothetical protein SFU99_04125, partial [Saprospiraceae bacterium]|nr:hypothetical protein [Saprospiraceae bacterium]
SLPALISWEIFTSIYLSGGLELNYLLSADAPGNFQVLDKDRKFDLSALFGIAFDFNEHWMADMRYTHGLLPLSNIAVFDQVIAPEAEYKWYNQTLQLALQYKF